MNSVEAYKGFISFLILSTIVGISVIGFKYVNTSSNNTSSASEADLVPYDIVIENVSTSEVNITWKTSKDNKSKIVYGKTKDNLSSEVSDDILTKSHKLNIKDLENSTTYYYRIHMLDEKYDPSSEFYDFSTSGHRLAPVVIETLEPIPSTEQMNDTVLEEDLNKPATPKKDLQYSGFESVVERNDKSNSAETLGKTTSIIGESIIAEFKEALIYKDLRYDFNRDSEVDADDYPLFIQFILNSED